MSTRSSQSSAATSTILDCLLVEGVPILTWINTLITNLQTQINTLEADMTRIEADLVAIHSQLAALQALLTALQACCASIQSYIANAHVPATLTQNQDVVNRTTFNVVTQVLNIPPPIIARIEHNGANPLNILVLDGGVLTPITGLALGFETVAGMVTGGKISVPKTGRYHVTGSWQTNVDETNPIDGYSIGLSFDINSSTGGSGRFIAPLISGRSEQTLGVVPGMALTIGDTVALLGLTDYPGGVLVTGGYLAIEYIEGT